MPVPASPNKSWRLFIIAVFIIGALLFLLRAHYPLSSSGSPASDSTIRHNSTRRAGESADPDAVGKPRRGIGHDHQRTEALLIARIGNADPDTTDVDEIYELLARHYVLHDPRRGFELLVSEEFQKFPRQDMFWICFSVALVREHPDDWFTHLSLMDADPLLKNGFALGSLTYLDDPVKAWTQFKQLRTAPSNINEQDAEVIRLLTTSTAPDRFFPALLRENSRPLYLAYFQAIPIPDPVFMITKTREIADPALSRECLQTFTESYAKHDGIGKVATAILKSDLHPSVRDEVLSNIIPKNLDNTTDAKLLDAATAIPYILDPALRETTLRLLTDHASKNAPDQLAEIHRIAAAPPGAE